MISRLWRLEIGVLWSRRNLGINTVSQASAPRYAAEPEAGTYERSPLSKSRPSPKRQRTGAVQDLADDPLLDISGSALDCVSDNKNAASDGPRPQPTLGLMLLSDGTQGRPVDGPTLGFNPQPP